MEPDGADEPLGVFGGSNADSPACRDDAA